MQKNPVSLIVLLSVLILVCLACNKQQDPTTPSAAMKTNEAPAARPNEGKDPLIVAAKMVEKCKKAHDMRLATETKMRKVKAESRDYDEYDRFQFCQWPPAQFADPDGYYEIVYRSAEGPGDCEATGANAADILQAGCRKLKLYYSFGSQGYSEHKKPFIASIGTTVWQDSIKYENEEGDLPFYPGRDELVVLRNHKNVLDKVECVTEAAADEIASSSPKKPSAATSQKEIMRVINGWNTALETREAEKLRPFICDKMIYYRASEPFSRERYLAEKKKVLDGLKYFDQYFRNDPKITLAGDTATVIVEKCYRFHSGDDYQCGLMRMTLRKSGDTWCIGGEQDANP